MRIRNLLLPVLWYLGSSIVAVGQPLTSPPSSTVRFAQQVRPILSENCYRCHGPDEAGREADLRLDRRDDAVHVLSSEEPQESEFLRRIRSEDPDEQMPPPGSKLQLSEDEKDVLTRWIEAGAHYEQHWSFRPLEPIAVPAVADPSWPRNAIDRFVLARLEQVGWRPNPEACRERLIRRLTFDLTGLPPTLKEIDQFLADRSPSAYESLVDRLLDRPSFGERMATDWLDLSRYSDSFGYQVDRDRFVWPWRDWVIEAFNSNLPHDQFLLWQLAGDLLPNASEKQILATTFNRLHPQKVEGGSIPEEFRVEYVADRTNTLGTAILGLTLECARCHDHKYDPISQREYYQLFAFFNNIDEAGLYSYFTESVPTPTLLLVNESQRRKMQEGEQSVADVQALLSRRVMESEAEFQAWLQRRPNGAEIPGELSYLSFDEPPAEPNRHVPGRFGDAVELTGDDGISLEVGNFPRYQPFSISLWINTPDVKERAVIFHRSRAWTDAGSRGYELLIEEGRLSAALIHFWPGNAIRVQTRDPIPTQQWLHVAVTYDGSSRADGLGLYINGEPADTQVIRDQLSKMITGGGGDTITIGERFRDRGFSQGSVDEFRVYERQLTAIEVAQLYNQSSLTEALTASTEKLSPRQRDQLRSYYLSTVDSDYRRLLEELRLCRRERCESIDGVPEIMVMRELPVARPTFLLRRGAYDAPGEQVHPATPRALPAFPDDQPPNRLGLARWLLDARDPLTARVAVNRYWQLCLGEGLVRTPEDFGSQGQPPTHPELLDWLAWDFVQHGWDVKRLIKRIVTSATYRQSAECSAEQFRQDPENRLLGRSFQYRLPAEMIRDSALAVSGLLVRQIGGPPVRPYELSVSFNPVEPDRGSGLYRRSLYTFWKRNAPAPVMITLDAARRDVCVVRRERTSSPTQALVLWNDPQLIEAARIFAGRLLDTHGSQPQPLVAECFRSLVGRTIQTEEASILIQLWEDQRSYFDANPDQAEAFLQVGQMPAQRGELPAELAATTTLVSTIMALDEWLMKR